MKRVAAFVVFLLFPELVIQHVEIVKVGQRKLLSIEMEYGDSYYSALTPIMPGGWLVAMWRAAGYPTNKREG